jgi:hypothetical protein
LYATGRHCDGCWTWDILRRLMWTLDYRADLRVDRRLKMIAYAPTI